MSRKFFVVIELLDDGWDGDKSDMATWIDASMNREALMRCAGRDIEAIVYDSMSDFLHDNVLDALSESGRD